MTDVVWAYWRMRRMHYRTWKGVGHWVAEAQRRPFRFDDPRRTMFEPGPLWFEIGEAPDVALQKLQDALFREFAGVL